MCIAMKKVIVPEDAQFFEVILEQFFVDHVLPEHANEVFPVVAKPAFLTGHVRRVLFVVQKPPENLPQHFLVIAPADVAICCRLAEVFAVGKDPQRTVGHKFGVRMQVFR